MYELPSSEMEALQTSIKECLNDTACLDAWIDSLEYDVKNYIGEKPFKAFRGFTNAMTEHLSRCKEILRSKEFLLDL